MNLKNKQVLVSVIVPTYNRGKSLCNTLGTLFDQDYKNYEIIVVDQSNKKFLIKEEFLKKNRKKLKVIVLDEPNLPKARNIGVKKAKGEIILFCDDDILAKKNLISAHMINFENSLIFAISGRVVTKNRKERVNFEKVGKILPWGSFLDGYSSKIRQEISNLFGCNFSLRKSVWKKVNGFDENFIGNALREETDLALRIKDLNGKIFFDPLPELLHIRAEKGGCRKNEERVGWYHDFFHNETYFFLKHFRSSWFLIFWLIRWQYFVRCMFVFGREVSWRSMKVPFLGISHGFRTYRRQNADRR